MRAASPRPPKWPLKLLRIFIKSDYLEEVEGDMEEIFFDDCERYGEKTARQQYTLDAIRLLRLRLIKNFKWIYKLNFIAMTINNFKIALRTLIKFKVSSAINLIGLAIGLTIGGLIILYVSEEWSFDKFHTKKDRIYKVMSYSGDESRMETNAWPVAYKLKTEFPEVESVIYSRRANHTLKVSHKDKTYAHNTFFASEDFFKIFDFDFIAGNPQTALTEPFSGVITKSLSDNYFDGDAIGKTLILRDTLKIQVTGVIDEIPRNSHIQFDILLSFKTFEKLADWFSYTEGWGNFNVRNYVLLKEGADIEAVRSKAKSLYVDNVGEWLEEMGIEFYVDLLALEDIYLRSGTYNGFGPSGSEERVQTVGLIAIFVLLLACINYINLSTARSTYRAKEVGIKKVSGSRRASLIGQFLFESGLLTFLAFLVAFVLMYYLLPFFNDIMGRKYLISYLFQPSFIGYIIGLGILIALLAGLYPAWVISGFKPLEAIKGESHSRRSGLRKSLIVFQFFVSSGLVISTLMVLNQINFMRNQDLGFDKEQILVIDGLNITNREAATNLKYELMKVPGVASVSHTNALPGRPGWQGQWAYAGEFSEDHVDTEYMVIDEDYIQTLGLEILAGGNFDNERPSELSGGLIINESCVHAMGWLSPEDAIGKEIVSPSSRPAGTVIGVVKDYHGLGLQENIWPKAMDYDSETYGRYYAIRFTLGDTYKMLKALEKSWYSRFENLSFNYFFLDDDFDRQYREEDRLARVLTIFAILILLISGIGLFGLISFVALSRTKEVGIRKTMGASISDIVYIFSKEFVTLVIIGNVIAIPLTWYLGNRWLENFAYHTEVQWLIFPATLMITVIIALLTISVQTLKTAKMNPVHALRYE